MINESLKYNSNLTKTQIPSVVLIIKLHSECKTRSPNHNEIISGNDFDEVKTEHQHRNILICS